MFVGTSTSTQIKHASMYTFKNANAQVLSCTYVTEWYTCGIKIDRLRTVVCEEVLCAL